MIFVKFMTTLYGFVRPLMEGCVAPANRFWTCIYRAYSWLKTCRIKYWIPFL